MSDKKSFGTDFRDIKESYLQYVTKTQFDEYILSKKNKLTRTASEELVENYLKLRRELTNERIKTLSRPTSPKKKYKRPTTPKHTVNKAALSYRASRRIEEMSKPKTRNLIQKETIVLGAVKPEALEHMTTEKEYELSNPRSWKYPLRDPNIKKEPFATSKAALRYVPTRRIVNLAKPLKRKMFEYRNDQ
ncbi:uncharacterized protein [Onthophagus taurus]|uniref:uncharacterized protein n=1 Tax=Onthophagus taurus TaxID=166361 RepID=UPI000C203EDB|nr:uncharacterized protein LOC111415893 [Onthophagus taurus]